jgi:hypothetical protein
MFINSNKETDDGGTNTRTKGKENERKPKRKVNSSNLKNGGNFYES